MGQFTSSGGLQVLALRQSSVTAQGKAKEQVLPVCLLLLCLVVLSGGYSLSTQFFSDDFTYLNIIARGPLELILNSFSARYMYYPIFGEHLRPLLTIPFAIDFMLFGINPVFLHLSNLLWHYAATVSCFYLARALANAFSLKHPFALASWTSVIFAVHPFHCENIAWWTAKNDIVYSTFFFLAFVFFLHARDSRSESSQRRLSGALQYLCFALSLLCKEQALIFPLLLSVFSFLKSSDPDLSLGKEAISVRLKRSFNETRYFWLFLVAFWTGRTILLGNVGASYYGLLTGMWTETFVDRFCNLRNLSVLWYPMDFEGGIFSKFALPLFGLCNLAFVLTAVLDFLKRKETASTPSAKDFALFLSVFALLAIIPVCLVWYPKTSLEGCRLLYLYSFPISGLYAYIALGKKSPSFIRQGLLSFLVLLFIGSSNQAHWRWSQASAQVFQIRQEIVETMRNRSDQKLVLLNVPNEYAGVSLFNYQLCLKDGLNRPFFKRNYGDDLRTLEPHFFDSPALVNPAALRFVESLHGTKDAYRFEQDPHKNWKLLPVSINDLAERKASSSLTLAIAQSELQEYEGKEMRSVQVLLPEILDGSRYQLLNLEFKPRSTVKKERVKFRLFWKSASMKAFDRQKSSYFDESLDQNAHLTIRVGALLNWICDKEIDAVQIVFADSSLNLAAASLASDQDLIPLLAPAAESRLYPDGTFHSRNGVFAFNYDATMIPSCSRVLVELMPAQVTFNSLQKEQLSVQPSRHVSRAFEIGGAKGIISIPDKLNSPLWHQMRILALNSHGTVLGYASDPVYLHSISAKSVKEDLE